LTWSEVVNAYKETTILNDVTVCLLIIGVLVILFFISYIFSGDYLFSIFGALVIMAVIGIVGTITMENEEKFLREKWVNEYAIPFIEGLPSQKIIVDQYSLANEKSYSSFFTKKEDFKTVKIQGKDENGEPIDMVLNVKIQPKRNISKPYVLYKKLKKDLPYKFKKGYYNAILFVPKDNH
jgi:hypothetical protein